MRPVECARAALAGCGVSYTNMESGNVLPTPDLPLGSRCCHGAPLLTNLSRHPADYKAPGWKSTCGRWGCAGAAVAGCGVELHQNGERERVLHTRLAIRFPPGCHGASVYWPIDRDIQWATERRAGDQHAAGRGVRERLWRVVEWSCTEMESGNVFYTPDLLLGSLRDVMGLRF